MQHDAEATRRVLMRNLVWPLTALTCLNSLDRVNVSFAALQMNADLGMSNTAYGLGASLFFVGYMVCQFPHTALLRRIGPRRWISTSVIAWGVVSIAMGCMQSVAQFYALRVSLGVAEAGFAPGIVLILRDWVPPRFRAGAIAGSMLAVPISVVLGGPVSGALLATDLGGLLSSWRFMFLVEGAITVLAGVVAARHFVDTPAQARFLTPEQKAWLAEALLQEPQDSPAVPQTSIVSLIGSVRIWAAAGVWFSSLSGAYGLMYWLPLTIKQLSGAGDFVVSVLSTLPWVALGVGMYVNAQHSDRTQERYWHVGLAAALAGCGIWAGGSVPPGPIALACLTLGALGLGGAQGAFWAIPTGFLTRASATRGITLLNLIGNCGGLITAPLIGALRSRTGSFAAPAGALGVMLLIGALLVPLTRRPMAVGALEGTGGE